MPKLAEYAAKRHFSTTPEPGPAVNPAGPALSYVVHKHAASRLHYDLRLELDGVYLSWAVPKGPSLDPADKRLAVHVEDHPVAYGGFEGVIPEGEYGGGTVMLWDRGTWRPDHGDPRQHLAQGHLKFDLLGERLKGKWMLVRTKGYGSGESWLLFKERDAEARPRGEFDALQEWTTSVATGRTMDEIASSDDPDPARLSHTRKAKAPLVIEPALATLVPAAPEGDEWAHEIKFDGYRIIARVDGGKVRLQSRNDKDWTDRFPEVASAVSRLGVDDAIFDGEVAVFRPDGTTDFQALQNRARSGTPADLAYVVFDLLRFRGYDLTASPLSERKALLEQVVGRSGSLLYSEHVIGRGKVFFEKACDMHLEGIVSKRLDAAYHSGRSRSWLKAKCVKRQEFVVVGWTDPRRSRQGFGALVLAVHDAGGLRLTGRVGAGFSEASLTDISRRLAPLTTESPPVRNAPQGTSARGIHWVEPALVAEVAFTEWTAEGSLRHPSFLGLREDKVPEEVARERPVDIEHAEKSDPSPVVAGLLLSNPDRVFWPDTGLTKLGLARYYESVADLMLPHVAGRPLSLVRCPGGYTQGCFYHKHIENFPKPVGTVDIFEPDAGKMAPYGTVSDLAGLVGLVQMGVLEIHPWGARKDMVDRPDRLIFDLDPDPELPFSQIAATALLLRSELGRLGLESWVKSTGGKGLHVVVPIDRRHSWDTAREFARAFVDTIVEMEPALFTGNMSKAKRGRRIFIDYLRNARGATAIAPYSTRARPGAPVAIPLSWDELDGATTPVSATVTTLSDRLKVLPEDPWREINSKRQSLSARVLKSLGVTATAPARRLGT
jgi:bifunctional non-homologous end joining protein LigD